MRAFLKKSSALGLCIILAGATALSGVQSAQGPAKKGAAAVDQARLDGAANEPQNWMTYGGTYDEQRFSTLAAINTTNVSKLSLAWSYQFDTNRGQEATPLVVDGVMYTSSAWSKVYAIDARTGRELWSYDPEVPGAHGVVACCDVVNRGVAVWKGQVFVGTIDGRLIALNAATGKLAWSVATTDATKAYTITGAPRVFKDKVVIGNGGADLGVRGYVTAYDTATGKLVWRFYTVPGDPAKGPDHAASDPIMATALKSWAGKWYDYGGGGTVWDSIVYDKDLDQLYIGVGNGSPWSRKVRSNSFGDNLFLASIVALDPDTGAYKWHYQAAPGESWDYTNTQQMTLATLNIGGAPRKVLMQAPKNGFFYVIDRANGKLLSAKNFVPVTWATSIDLDSGRPNYVKNAFYEDGPLLALPSSLGAHSWHPMSYSPRTGLVYIPAMQRPAVYGQDDAYSYKPNRWNTAVARPKIDGEMPPVWGALIAWDPIKQAEAWRVPQGDMWNGGTLATAGDVVFAGNGHGEFNAYRASDGKKLWGFDAQAGVMAGPISYSIAGEQYVAVLAGSGGAYPLLAKVIGQAQKAPPAGRVLVFKLGGAAKLPPYTLTLSPANPSSETFTPEQIAQGQKLYGNCGVCHGGSVLPDLRRSAALTDKDMWKSIVIDGALSANGMASFAKWLKPEEAEMIRAFINQQALDLKKTEAL